MLSILGIGGARPLQIITNEFLREVHNAFPGSPEKLEVNTADLCAAIRGRATTLPLDYILTTGNRDPFNSHRSALETPTDLAFRAAEQALTRAGITRQQIGLIIGDSSTPLESTPSEGQRLGKRLGIKVPAYDVWGGSSSFVLHLSVLANRKPESVPPYVMGASANVPTQSVCYGGHTDSRFFLPQYIFGDAAASWVASWQTPGRLMVRDAVFISKPGFSQQFCIDTYGFMALSPEFYVNQLADAYTQAFRLAFEKHPLDRARTKVVASFSHPGELSRLCDRYEIPIHNRWLNQSAAGDSLGASPAWALSEHWEELLAGDTVLVACAGAGLSYGYAVLEVG